MKNARKITRLRSALRSYITLHVAVAVAVFLVTFGASLYYWNNLRNSVQADRQAIYERQMSAFEATVSLRLQQYEQLVRGGRAALTVDPNLTQDKWSAYFQSYQISTNYPEVQGIGLSRYLTSDQLPAYVSAQQAHSPNFQIYPAGARDVYVPVTFNAKFNDNNNGASFGYDGFTSPVRRAAMQDAAQSGQPRISGLITLVSDPRPDYPAFIMYVPMYQPGKPLDTPTERMQALSGFTYVSLDMRRMLDDLPLSNRNLRVAEHIEDADAPIKNLSYENATFQSIATTPGSLKSARDVSFYGRRWHITFVASPDIISLPERQLPDQALWRGLFSSLLFSGLVWYLITNRERKYARQKIQEVQIAKDDLLSLASHQLRTPATVVKQYVGMLLQGYAGKLARHQREMLTHAYESNERQLEIINQLLYVARLDAGRLRMRKERTDLTKLVRAVAADQAESIKEHDHTLTYELPQQAVMARIDPHFIGMVVENLLSNAIKYTPEGGTVGLGVHKDHAEVLITVSDSGVGIASGEQKAIFDKFTRVENDLSSDMNGSGVGLYLTRQIVQLHKGTIEVHSKPGQGSTFVVRLPIETGVRSVLPQKS